MWCKERRPYQFAVLLAQCQFWGYDEHDYQLETVLKTSNLVHPPDVVMATEEEFYGLTHNVMLPTFFGTGHPELLNPPLPYDLELAIRGGLLRSMASGNADAVLELLITGALQRQLSDRLAEYAVRWLAEEKTTETHVVPPAESESVSEAGSASQSDSTDAPMSRSEVLDSLAGPTTPAEDAETRTWAKRYHTNLVAGMMVPVLNEAPEITTDQHSRVSLSSAEFRGMVALGQALNQLQAYDLGGAAETLSEIRPETFEQFPEISRRIVSFLDAQQSGDSFGYWVDERRLYEQKHGDDSGFEDELVAPISEQCRTVVAEVRSCVETPATQ